MNNSSVVALLRVCREVEAIRIRIIAIGRIRTHYIRAAVDEFLTRLRPYYPCEELELKAASGLDPQRAIEADSAAVLEKLLPGERCWLLDREGRAYSSEEISQALRAEELHGYTTMTVVIGGAYGLNARVQQRADLCWSLSRLTFLHEWARAILLEQLYRATKILRNEPYHH